MTAYSFKRRFVTPIQVGLGQIEHIPGTVPKLQTIRAIGKRHHAKPGDTLQLYTAMRTKQCRLIGEAVCTAATPIVIWIYGDLHPRLSIQSGKLLLNGKEIRAFARMDGFHDVADMAEFWRAEHPGIEKFEGIMISWRPRP